MFDPNQLSPMAESIKTTAAQVAGDELFVQTTVEIVLAYERGEIPRDKVAGVFEKANQAHMRRLKVSPLIIDAAYPLASEAVTTLVEDIKSSANGVTVKGADTIRGDSPVRLIAREGEIIDDDEAA